MVECGCKQVFWLFITKLLYYPASVIGIRFVGVKEIHFPVAETIQAWTPPIAGRVGRCLATPVSWPLWAYSLLHHVTPPNPLCLRSDICEGSPGSRN